MLSLKYLKCYISIINIYINISLVLPLLLLSKEIEA